MTRTVDIRKRGGERTTTIKVFTKDLKGDKDEYTCAFKTDFRAQQNIEVGELLMGCGPTSHIINDISMFHKFDESFKPDKYSFELANGKKGNNVSLNIRAASMKFADSKRECVSILLTNALYAPKLP